MVNYSTQVMTLAFTTLLLSGCGGYSNYGECILDQVVEAENDRAARVIMMACMQSYSSPSQGEGQGIFSYSDGNGCVLDKAKKTKSSVAASMVRQYCNLLYDEPVRGSSQPSVNPFARFHNSGKDVSPQNQQRASEFDYDPNFSRKDVSPQNQRGTTFDPSSAKLVEE
jgi:hypothetical protein